MASCTIDYEKVTGAGLLIWEMVDGRGVFTVKIRLKGKGHLWLGGGWIVGNEDEIPSKIKEAARNGEPTPIMVELYMEDQFADYIPDAYE